MKDWGPFLKRKKDILSADVWRPDLARGHSSIAYSVGRNPVTPCRCAFHYENDHAFLVGWLIDHATLERAEVLAKCWKVPVHHVLLSAGWVKEDDYFRALAAHCGIDYFTSDDIAKLRIPKNPALRHGLLRSGIIPLHKDGHPFVVIAPETVQPSQFRKVIASLGAQSSRVALTPPSALRKVLLLIMGKQLTREAIYGLQRRYPGQSAVRGLTTAQKMILAVITGSFTGIGLVMPGVALAILSVCLTIYFLAIVGLRFLACIHLLEGWEVMNKCRQKPLMSDAALPVYTVLVPLFREHKVLPDLVKALNQLSYPAAKLDIKLIFESVDRETRAVAEAMDLPGNIELITVPDSQPQTKPKALNFALQRARGEFTVIYDAEDQPEPDQLRKAVAAFQKGPPHLACLQSKLSYYNVHENWLTKQFSIEYAALFDGFLPALQAMRLPIPLGGTSNHFRTSVLKRLGGWDAFNVTEDADLGMRIYRHGLTCRVLDSTTYEEANCRLGNWIRQRTRWLKGWLQTYFVHMRHPVRLWQDLGLRGFMGFQAIIGGLVISSLVHPLFLIQFLTHALSNLGKEASLLGAFFNLSSGFWLLAVFNLCVGYLSAMGLGAIALRQRGLKGLGLQILLMPFYWLLISIAAYRAIYQWVRAPFYWEKTEHGISRFRPGPQ